MKKNKRFIYGILVAIPFLIMGTGPVDIMSDGAPASSSGAPDEQTCAVEGCHSDSKVNAGDAQLSLLVGDGETYYEPGKTYTMKVKIEDPGVVRFGYQLLALQDSDSKNAGAFVITDPNRTHVLQNYAEKLDRRYATYTYEGSSAVETGKGEWTLDWTAPAQDVGPITLYLAGISADNDMTDKGDDTYTTSVKLSPKALSVPDLEQGSTQLFVDVSGQLNISFQLATAMHSSIDVYDLNGRLVSELLADQNLDAGQYNYQFPLNGISKGIYFIKIATGDQSQVQKILL